jgi:hypothetical protein
VGAWEEFTKEQDALQQEFESGKITEAQYLKDTRSDWTVFIGKAVVAVAGTVLLVLPVTLGTQAVLKSAQARMIAKLQKTGPWTATFTKMIETATPAGMAGFVAYLNSESGTKHFVDWLTSAGGKCKGVDGVIEWATNPSQFLGTVAPILSGSGTNSNSTSQSQSGQRPQPQQPNGPPVGTTPGGAPVTGKW